MRYILHYILIVLVLVTRVTVQVNAQEYLTETYSSLGDSFSFRYPGGWSLADYGTEIVLSNSGKTTMSAEDLRLMPGEVQIRILSPISVALYRIGSEQAVPNNIELAVWSLMHDYLVETRNSLNNMQTGYVDFGDYRALLASSSDVEGRQATSLAFEVANGKYVIISAITVVGEWETFEPTVLALAETVQFTFREPIPWPAEGLALDETFIFDEGRFSLGYPASWTVQAFPYSGTTFILNTPWALVSMAQTGSLESGQFLGVLISPTDLQIMFPGFKPTNPTEIAMRLVSTATGSFDAPQELTLQGKSATILRGNVDTVEGEELGHFIVVVEIQPKEFVTFSVSTHTETMSQVEEAFVEIAESVRYLDS